MRKISKYLMILMLSLMLSMTFLTASEAKVEAMSNKIVMDVQDAIDLYRYIAQLEAENKALREGLERERKATSDYVTEVTSLLEKHEQERYAWQKLADELNAEVANNKTKTFKYSTIALILGGIIGAIAAQ